MNLTPAEIVRELSKHIVGQEAAKRAVAVALRNRYRRKKLPPEIAREVTPKNILMIGPTGVGKTEIARRLARLAGAPFVKVEATKFTEVGYVGRDVDSIVRDLAEASYQLVLEEMKKKVEEKALALAEEELATLLRTSVAEVRSGRLDGHFVEVQVEEEVALPFMGVLGGEAFGGMGEMLKGLLPRRPVRRRMTVREAREVLKNQHAERLIDKEELKEEARRRAQEEGIVFIDEIDKVARREGDRGPRRLRGRGAAGPPPHRGGDGGLHEDRPHLHGARPLHRRRGLPRGQALGPDPRAPGAVSHQGGAFPLGPRGVLPHPQGAGELPHPPVHGAPQGGRHRARL